MSYKTNKNYFNIPNLENSYWAGFIAADGCLWGRGDAVEIGLQEKDKVHLQNFANSVGYDGLITKRKTAGSFASSQCAYRIIFYGTQQWHMDLINNFNITPRKTATLQPPLLVANLALAYIAGYIDGDGCINIDKSREGGIRISMLGTENVLLWIKTILDKVSDYNYNNQGLASPCKRGNIFQYQIRGKRARDIFDAIQSLRLPVMKRKWEKFADATN